MKSVARSFVFAAVSSAGVALSLQPALAVPTDVLPLNTNLAIYFDELPVLTETQVNLTNSGGTPTATGTAGATTVNFLANLNVDAASGNATIKPTDNHAVISQLTISTVGYTFGDLKFSAQLDSQALPPPPGGNYALDLTIEAWNNGTLLGSYTFNHPPVDKNADEKFLVLVEGGPLDMTQVILKSTVGALQFKQFYLSDLTCIGENCGPPGGPGPGSTPLPAAVWLFGTVLAGGAGISRWRKRRQARMIAT